MNDDTRKLIKRWKLQAAQQTDPFVRFFILYMCLDAWISEESLAEYDRGKLDWLINSDNDLKSYWDSTPHKTVPLNGLMGVHKVENMHPNHRGEFVYLDDSNDLGKVVKFIYQIRCNLFHGGKSPTNRKDKDLTRWSATILDNWLT